MKKSMPAKKAQQVVRSMTGFGRGESQVGDVHVVCDLRSVNHRFLDLKIRLPQEASDLESDLRKMLTRQLSRGRVDLSLKLIRENSKPRVHLDHDLIGRCLDAVGSAQRELSIPGVVDMAALLRIPGVLRIDSDRGVELGRKEKTAVQEAVANALRSLCRVREREGEALKRDLLRRLRSIGRHMATVERRRGGVAQRLSRRLKARVRKLADGVNVDPGRLAQEVAFLAERSDITEELVRLRAHLDSMEQLLQDSAASRGKELDFLTQELHRETNTIHSKADDLTIGRAALAIKSEVEKIREQVQNVE